MSQPAPNQSLPLWRRLRDRLLPPLSRDTGTLAYWRELVLLTMYMVGMVVGLAVFLPIVYYLYLRQAWGVLALDSAVLLWAVLSLVYYRLLPYRLRAGAAVIIFLGVGFMVIWQLGPFSGGMVWLFAGPAVAALLLGLRWVWASLGAAALFTLFVGWQVAGGQVAWAPDPRADLVRWLITSLNFILITAAISLSVAVLTRGLENSLVGVRRSKEELDRSQTELRFLLDNLEDFIYTHDLEGRFLSINRAAAAKLGYMPEDLVGRNIAELMLPQHRAAFQYEYMTAVKDQGAYAGAARYMDTLGHPHTVVFKSQLMRPPGRPPYVYGSGSDITERVQEREEKTRLEAQLRQAQKMEAVGVMAGGLAHDFNNILQAISGFGELLIRRRPRDEDDRRHLEHILQATRRASELVQRLMTFSRKVEPRLIPLDLNREVEQAVEVLGSALPKSVEIRARLEAAPSAVKADATQLEQVLFNLGTNASDAMPEGGVLEITTDNVALDDEYCRRRVGLRPGGYLRLTVTDTGQGMDEKVLQSLYDPFFTTKAPGKGTGLGMSMVYGIVQAHGGYIECRSRPGQGTAFDLYFPPYAGRPREEEEAPADDGAAGGGQTVLVVDDEPDIRELVCDLLRETGYHVLTAGSGEEALEVHASGRALDLILMDLGLPGMGGFKALVALRERDPAVKVLVASGYTGPHQRREIIAAGAVGFLAKPYRLDKLLAEVSRGVSL